MLGFKVSKGILSILIGGLDLFLLIHIASPSSIVLLVAQNITLLGKLGLLLDSSQSQNIEISLFFSLLKLLSNLLLLVDDSQHSVTLRVDIFNLSLEWDTLQIFNIYSQFHAFFISSVCVFKGELSSFGYISYILDAEAGRSAKILLVFVSEFKGSVQSKLNICVGSEDFILQNIGKIIGDILRIDSCDTS